MSPSPSFAAANLFANRVSNRHTGNKKRGTVIDSAGILNAQGTARQEKIREIKKSQTLKT
jgi:hypothetical protein